MHKLAKLVAARTGGKKFVPAHKAQVKAHLQLSRCTFLKSSSESTLRGKLSTSTRLRKFTQTLQFSLFPLSLRARTSPRPLNLAVS
mmetsp:Transcript_10336/g.20344  ORF Transcript_10336/g.20344 Transcript_10336/m.20344 type:complete len:86 (-) Transcript_10336:13-270(-)